MPNKDLALPQDIEKLRQRHRALETQKITAEANLNNSEEILQRLKKQAREQYGTDDVEELRKKLEEMKSENQRKCADYQQHLDDIERDLKKVEEMHAETAVKETQV
jgi:hypothetical protein